MQHATCGPVSLNTLQGHDLFHGCEDDLIDWWDLMQNLEIILAFSQNVIQTTKDIQYSARTLICVLDILVMLSKILHDAIWTND